MAEKVQCAGCGFLAILDDKQSTYISPPSDYRLGGWRPGPDIPPAPFCAKHVFVLDKEAAQARATAEGWNRERAIKHVLNTDGSCDRFFDWLPGVSLTGHHLDELAQMRRAADRTFQRKMVADNRVWTLLTAALGTAIGAAIGAIIATQIGLAATRADPPAAPDVPTPPAVQLPSPLKG